MTGFCDSCGECFAKATSKFCSVCGQQRASELTETAVIETVHADDVVEQETTVALWYVSEYSGTKPITLYDRVYGKKPHGVGSEILWGKAFLKSHTEYCRQHKKMHKFFCIVREWFLPGTNEFVDKVLNSSSLRWNKSFTKELTKYCEEKRKSGPKKDLIKTLEFPNEGLSLRWKTCDIVRHVYTIKKYRRSSKAQKTRTSVDLPQFVGTGMEVSVPEVPVVDAELPSEVEAIAPHDPVCALELAVLAPKVPIRSLDVSGCAPEVGRIGRINPKVIQKKTSTVQKEKTPRVRKPSLKVREQAS